MTSNFNPACHYHPFGAGPRRTASPSASSSHHNTHILRYTRSFAGPKRRSGITRQSCNRLRRFCRMQAAWLSSSRPFSATLWRAAAEWVCGQCVDLLTFESLLLHVSPCMGFHLPLINYAPDVPKFPLFYSSLPPQRRCDHPVTSIVYDQKNTR